MPIYENKGTGIRDEFYHAPLWTFLFGAIYLAIRGLWGHAAIYFIINFIIILSAGPVVLFSLLATSTIYAICVNGILRRKYLLNDWIEVKPGSSVGSWDKQKKSCPFCAEEILAEAIKCKHCGSSIHQQEEAVIL